MLRAALVELLPSAAAIFQSEGQVNVGDSR
jgi:hypothetical protein